jgi:hypothetical protein
MDRNQARRLDDGIILFNRGQFFEAHEVWEDAWRGAQGDDEVFLHGLIQVAAGFHKLQCGQPSGTVSLLTKGAEKLAALPAGRCLPGLPSFRGSVESWKEIAARMAEQGATGLDAAALPRLPPPRRPLLERRLETHVEIEASARRVWEILADFPAYALWNPFIVAIAGEPRRGARLTATLRPPAGRGMTFRPVVLVADPHRELRWLGRLVLPDLFDGEHIFTIAPFSTARVRFSQRETFRGLLVPLMPRSLWDDTRREFEAMNEALKKRAES